MRMRRLSLPQRQRPHVYRREPPRTGMSACRLFWARGADVYAVAMGYPRNIMERRGHIGVHAHRPGFELGPAS